MKLSRVSVRNGKQENQFVVSFGTDISVDPDEIYKHIFWHDLDSARAETRDHISKTDKQYTVDYLNTVLAVYNYIEKYNLMPNCK